MAARSTKHFLFHTPPINSANTQIPTLVKALKPTEKILSIEVTPTNPPNLDAISRLRPTFCSVVWHQSSRFNFGKPGEIEPLVLAKKLIEAGQNVLLHFSARYLKKEEAASALDEAKRVGVRNIFAIKGEYVATLETSGEQFDFKEATDLIKFIRTHYQNHFSICVAGYPDRHPRFGTFEEDTQALAEKIRTGADFIITQSIFNKEKFKHFTHRCRQAGINVPILPGLWIFDTYERFKNCERFCKVELDEEFKGIIERFKSDPEALKQHCIDSIAELARDLLEEEEIVGVHLFSLNNVEFVGEIAGKLMK